MICVVVAWLIILALPFRGYRLDYFNRLWDCPEEGSSNPGPGSGVHTGPPVRVDRGSNAIPVHPITAGSAELPDWLIREAEETLEINIRSP